MQIDWVSDFIGFEQKQTSGRFRSVVGVNTTTRLYCFSRIVVETNVLVFRNDFLVTEEKQLIPNEGVNYNASAYNHVLLMLWPIGYNCLDVAHGVLGSDPCMSQMV